MFAGSGISHAQSSALDEIRIGVVGCGGRGANLARLALKADNRNRLVAMGDVFDDRLDAALQSINRDRAIRDQVDVPTARRFLGFDAYQQLLGADVDFVFFATPAAFRPLHFSAAVAAGKHSYIEKPLTVDSTGVRQIMKANAVAKRKRLSASAGLTHRHSDRYSQFITRIQNNAIGDIQSLELDLLVGSWSWFRRQPETKELEYQIRNFRRFVWLGGGPMLEHQIHSIDNCNWLMNSHPVRASGQGDVSDQMGVERCDGFGSFSTQFHYPDGAVLNSEFAYTNSSGKRRVESVRGIGWNADMNKGTIYHDGNVVDWQYGKKKDDFNTRQIVNLFAALRNGKIINEVDSACDSTWTAIMGRTAGCLGRDVTWQETVESEAVLALPEFASLNQQAPINPDKFGDYATAASHFST